MANTKELCQGRVIQISCRRATFVVCAGNVVVMLCMMYLILTPSYRRSSSCPDLAMAVAPNGRYSERNISKEDLERMKSSYKLRRALMPTHRIEEVEELQAEMEVDFERTKMLSAARYKRSVELSRRLAHVRQSNIQSVWHGLLQKWKKEKFQGAKRYEGRHQSGISNWKVRGGAIISRPPVNTSTVNDIANSHKNISEKIQ